MAETLEEGQRGVLSTRKDTLSFKPHRLMKKIFNIFKREMKMKSILLKVKGGRAASPRDESVERSKSLSSIGGACTEI